MMQVPAAAVPLSPRRLRLTYGDAPTGVHDSIVRTDAMPRITRRRRAAVDDWPHLSLAGWIRAGRARCAAVCDDAPGHRLVAVGTAHARWHAAPVLVGQPRLSCAFSRCWLQTSPPDPRRMRITHVEQRYD